MARDCSTCKYAGQVNGTMVWCTKKEIYTSKEAAESCDSYEAK
ncbi:MAG: hypothetical protein ACP6IU_09565 [Candidatus Asgardarchaeia archaeon]